MRISKGFLIPCFFSATLLGGVAEEKSPAFSSDESDGRPSFSEKKYGKLREIHDIWYVSLAEEVIIGYSRTTILEGQFEERKIQLVRREAGRIEEQGLVELRDVTCWGRDGSFIRYDSHEKTENSIRGYTVRSEGEQLAIRRWIDGELETLHRMDRPEKLHASPEVHLLLHGLPPDGHQTLTVLNLEEMEFNTIYLERQRPTRIENEEGREIPVEVFEAVFRGSDPEDHRKVHYFVEEKTREVVHARLPGTPVTVHRSNEQARKAFYVSERLSERLADQVRVTWSASRGELKNSTLGMTLNARGWRRGDPQGLRVLELRHPHHKIDGTLWIEVLHLGPDWTIEEYRDLLTKSIERQKDLKVIKRARVRLAGRRAWRLTVGKRAGRSAYFMSADLLIHRGKGLVVIWAAGERQMPEERNEVSRVLKSIQLE